MKWHKFLKQLGMMIILEKHEGNIPAIKNFILLNNFFSSKSDFSHVLRELQEFKIEEFKKSDIFNKGNRLLHELIVKLNK